MTEENNNNTNQDGAMADDDKGYTVGYGKPPRHTRFPKGQSGNPKGRPKGSLNVATILPRMLRETVTYKEGGKKRRKTKYDVMWLQQVNKAVAGNNQSFKLVNERVEKGNSEGFGKRGNVQSFCRISVSDLGLTERDLAAV
jgi:hypothetical protein